MWHTEKLRIPTRASETSASTQEIKEKSVEKENGDTLLNFYRLKLTQVVSAYLPLKHTGLT